MPFKDSIDCPLFQIIFNSFFNLQINIFANIDYESKKNKYKTLEN